MHYSFYDCAPKRLYDQNLINQAKATMSQSQLIEFELCLPMIVLVILKLQEW